MTESEREFLARVLSRAPTSVARWLRGGANALALWAASLLLFALAWMLVAWALRATVHVDLGWDSPAAGRIAATGAVACALLASVSAARWLKGWSDPRPQLRADLEGGQVAEESYRFTQARHFQEPEHGGLIYFLRTADDEVLALYDHESADLGAAEENPLDAGHPLELAVPPSSWLPSPGTSWRGALVLAPAGRPETHGGVDTDSSPWPVLPVELECPIRGVPTPSRDGPGHCGGRRWRRQRAYPADAQPPR